MKEYLICYRVDRLTDNIIYKLMDIETLIIKANSGKEALEEWKEIIRKWKKEYENSEERLYEILAISCLD